MEKKVTDAILGALAKIHDEQQDKPDQFIVLYKRKSDDSVIGYHSSSFCQLTKEALKAKRYNGSEPDKQLEIIWSNFQYMMRTTEEDTKAKDISGLFAGLRYNTKISDWQDINADDVYIDVEYLTEGTPKQEFSAILIDPQAKKDGPVSETE